MSTRSFLSALVLTSIIGCAPSQDLDMVDDAGARAIFDAFDGGQLAVPTNMDWSIPEMVRGADITITVQGGPDTKPVILAATGNVNGNNACPPQIAPECMDIAGPFVILGTSRTDVDGTAVFNLRVPPTLSLNQVKLQALSLSGGVLFATPGTQRSVIDAANESCDDGIDNDGNGLFDCLDPACAGDAVCGVSPLNEAGGAACTDGIDNDGDGFTDCNDFSCRFDSTVDLICGVTENTNDECIDGDDNDGNTFFDCMDFGCSHFRNPAVTVCLTTENTEGACSDGVDNDGNGSMDCADPTCADSSSCGGSGFDEATDAQCDDGIDNDGDGASDCSDSDCFAATPCVIAPEDNDAACSDGFDNDGDDDTDCFDADCAGTSACAAPTGIDLMVNEFLADPNADAVLGDANCDGTRNGVDDEFVEIVNFGSQTMDLTGVSISDGVAVRHEFGSGETLAPGKAYVVFGGGTPTFDGTSINTSPWCGTWPADVQSAVASSGSISLNNSGDSVILALNGVVFAQTDYGSEGGADQSLTRLVDSDPMAAFEQHTLVSGSIGECSPGWTAAGGTF